MKHLIVYAHPNPASFCSAIREVYSSELARHGNSVEIVDLYKIGFKPALDSADFAEIQSGKIPADIKAQQDKIAAADIITFIAPVWWLGVPAILKGYYDRVFLKGFAYNYTQKGPVPLLGEKNIIIINTTGNPREDYQRTGMNTCIEHSMSRGLFGFCGIKV
ncbi:MAG: NAD(P)H-dependent oxidoreductase, partial [Elusimicrobiaceae bacterium]